MICPQCHSARCRRSRRRTVADYVIGVFGLRPWRCRSCETRFYARLAPAKFWRFAHCPRCGNLYLERIGRERVHGAMQSLLVSLGLNAYRCDPCRHRFVSMRAICTKLRQPEPPAAEEPAA